MIAPVDAYLEAFAEAGADTISIHVEAGPHTTAASSTFASSASGQASC